MTIFLFICDKSFDTFNLIKIPQIGNRQKYQVAKAIRNCPPYVSSFFVAVARFKPRVTEKLKQ